MFFVVLGRPSPAAAQEGSWQVEGFEARSSTSSVLGVGTPHILGHRRFQLELWGNYSDRPIELSPVAADDPRAGGVVVPSRLRMEVLAHAGFLDLFAVGLAVPITRTTGTSDVAIAGRETEDFEGTFLGDVRVDAQLDILALIRRARSESAPAWGPGLAFALTGWLPTGNKTALEGEARPRLEPELLVDLELPFGLRLGGRVGYHIRARSQVFNYIADDLFTWGGTVSVPLGTRVVEALVAVAGTVQTTDQPNPLDPQILVSTPAYNPVELRGGVRVTTPKGLHFGVSAGGPLARGIGGPRFRVVGWVGMDVDLRRRPVGVDPDKDGIATLDDLCPFEAESLDHVRDGDGCPEADAARYEDRRAASHKDEVPPPDPIFAGEVTPPRSGMALLTELQLRQDGDGDGVVDPEDLCPEQAEDPDGFLDADGCADPDDDGDGVLDGGDRCPREAETANQWEDTDGCPDEGPDEDKDGVGDWQDLCPKEPENRDGLRDGDGCPEASDVERARVVVANPVTPAPTNEGAVPEPVLPEEAPPVLLPAPPVIVDADSDGVRDDRDDCPNVAEDTDGFQDGDGCADPDDDGDGYLDGDDRCPREAESRNSVLDGDGCPDVEGDLDGDGLLDASDLCPLEPESWNGVRDGDGCPEDGQRLIVELPQPPGPAVVADAGAEPVARPVVPPVGAPVPPDLQRPVELPELVVDLDSDGDGWVDGQDLCPGEPEDMDGRADADGCPDLDVDLDGIPDEMDKCPQDAETRNGTEDEDGCPDRGADVDRDGVEDRADLCPFERENVDGIRDEDGCPESDAVTSLAFGWKPPPPRVGAPKPPPPPAPRAPETAATPVPVLAELGAGDSDGDGIFDRGDLCVDRIEDVDGYADDDGCPEDDNDGDGIKDARDRCPDAAESRNGILDDDGCPDRGFDADDDGVDDVADLCPREAEDRDGVRDGDGCPEEQWEARPGSLGESYVRFDREEAGPTPTPAIVASAAADPTSESPPTSAPEVALVRLAVLPPLRPQGDDDQDGLADWEDDCPRDAEDGDGFLDDDGCPEYDDDLDSVPDDRDHCPRDAETANGYEDEDGCPEAAPAPVIQVSGIVRGIGFGSGSDRLLQSSWKLLRDVQRVLHNDPLLVLTVYGHTDSQGDHDKNVRLSRARAQAVATWLINQGIRAERLTVVGEGPDRPIESNTDAAGRASNRRVELTYEHLPEPR